MQTTSKRLLPNRFLAGLSALAIALGFASGSVLAVEVSEEDYKLLQKIKQQQAKKELPAHEQPHTKEPPTGGHSNLAAAATNPIANAGSVSDAEFIQPK